MKLQDARITILFSDKGLHIEVTDEASGTQFLEIELNEKQTCEALSRCSRTECTAEVRGLDRVGLHLEIAWLVFEYPEDVRYSKDEDRLLVEAMKPHVPEGWTASEYFGSRDQFFTRNGKYYARASLRRWLPDPPLERVRKQPFGVVFDDPPPVVKSPKRKART